MNRVVLLERLKDFTEESVKNLILPVKLQKGDAGLESRCPNVYLMRLPNGNTATKYVPYVLHTVLTGEDQQSDGRTEESLVTIRSIFCVYNENEEEGAMMLLNLMERLRIDLLKNRVLGQQFRLKLSRKLETLVYPNESAPYYAGEMITVWELPSVKEEPKIW